MTGLLRISIWQSKELQSVVLTMRGLPRDLAKNIRQVTKAEVAPLWQEAVSARVSNHLESKVLANTARTSVGDSNILLKSGAIGKALRGGGTPPQLVAGTEFGSDQYKQFGPKRKAGPVYRAAAAVIPKIASVWAKTVIATLFSLLPDKGASNG